MKIAIVSDELYPVNLVVIDWLKSQGHELVLLGALKTKQDESWVSATAEAAQLIVENKVAEGIFFCWTGTGSAMVANRFPAIRAALCVDAQTARGARVWNHANVLVLSNRLLSQDVAKEILTAWFEDYDKAIGAKQVEALRTIPC